MNTFNAKNVHASFGGQEIKNIATISYYVPLYALGGLPVVENKLIPRGYVIHGNIVYVSSMWAFRQEVRRANGQRLPRRVKKRLKKEFW